MVSCTKDEAEASIEGKWNYESASATINGVKVSDIGGYVGDVNTAGCSKNYILLNTGGVAESGVYTGTSCKLTKTTGTWAKDGSTLTLKTEDDTETYTVESISDTTLKIKTTEEESGLKVEVIATFIKG